VAVPWHFYDDARIRQSKRVKLDAGITFLPTNDIQSTNHFYQVICGLRLVQDQGVCRIYEVCEGAYWGFCEHIAPLDNPRSVMLTLVTDNVDEWHRQLSEQGVQTDGVPRLNEKFGIFHFFADTPEGYRLEIQRFLDEGWKRS
jgi:catechol 2,3-dioxygenase-like lactoylglutathione lyase family enzyme